MSTKNSNSMVHGLLYGGGAFAREDETDDGVFYSHERFVNHLDSIALATVKNLIETLVVEERPIMLDLMAGWDSHIPKSMCPAKIVGLGLNEKELSQNKALTEYVLHDLNKDPALPFPEDTFDAVLNTVSVDYMTRPFEVFREVGRILKPGGLFLVIFSNRMFPQKVVKIWRESTEAERVLLVEDFFKEAEAFEKPKLFLSKGRPRPKDDKYAHLGIPSDPIYAVYAEKGGEDSQRPRKPEVVCSQEPCLDKTELERRKALTRTTLRCPYCGERMKKWAVPESPFTCWDCDFMYICFNDTCPYLLRGWDEMNRQGNTGLSYRLRYNPIRDSFKPIPVQSLRALKDSIVEED